MSEPDLLRGPPLLGLLLRLLHQHWSQSMEAALRTAGFGDIRPPHANVFAFVPSEGIQVSELAQLSQVRKQTMAQVVEQLEEMGYVERRLDPRDRRGRLVFLTERGQAVRPVGEATGRRVEQHWAQLTSPETIQALRGSLEALLAELGRHRHPGDMTSRPASPLSRDRGRAPPAGR